MRGCESAAAVGKAPIYRGPSATTSSGSVGFTSAHAARYWCVGGPDILQDEHDFTGLCQTKLASSLGFNRGRFFVQPSLFLTKPRVLLFQGVDARFFDVCLLPGTHRDEESLFANQRVRRQHDRHEQERRVQQPPPTRGWRHRGWFPPPERFGSRLSAGCRHNGRTHDWRRHWPWGSPLYNTFRAEAARKLGPHGPQALNFRY